VFISASPVELVTFTVVLSTESTINELFVEAASSWRIRRGRELAVLEHLSYPKDCQLGPASELQKSNCIIFWPVARALILINLSSCLRSGPNTEKVDQICERQHPPSYGSWSPPAT